MIKNIHNSVYIWAVIMLAYLYWPDSQLEEFKYSELPTPELVGPQQPIKVYAWDQIKQERKQ